MNNNIQPSNVVFDNLPYVDHVTDEAQQEALDLVEQEMQHMEVPRALPTTIDNMKYMPREEFEKQAAEASFTSPGEVQAPTSNDVEAWREAVRTVKARLEEERQLSMLLEVEKEEAVPVYQQHNRILLQLQKDCEQLASRQQDAVQSINLQRQTFQTERGQELEMLERDFQRRLQKMEQLQEAIDAMQAEIAQMRA